MKFYTIAFALLASLNAHVTVTPNQAVEGSYASATLRIPHGCDKSDTVKVIIEFDQDAINSKVQFSGGIVGGWKSEVVTEQPKKLERRQDSNNGNTNSGHSTGPVGPTTAIIYSDGKIPYNMFADFPITFKLPAASALPKEKNNTIYFKASQLCENKQWLNWTSPTDPKYPSASFKILSKEQAATESQKSAPSKSSASSLVSGTAFIFAIFYSLL